MSDIDYGEFNFEDRDFEEKDGQGSGEQEQHFEEDEPRMEATFHEMQEKQIFSEELNPRSAQDKPFILLRDALLRLEQEPKYIDDAIREMRKTPSFPTLNAVYVGNARLFLSSGQPVENKAIKKWVTDRNKQFNDKEYLNETDFFRYLIIGQNIFKE
jgi:hypothetical protein